MLRETSAAVKANVKERKVGGTSSTFENHRQPVSGCSHPNLIAGQRKRRFVFVFVQPI
jgi:hypothetical protein